jgi:hypothetical protein
MPRGVYKRTEQQLSNIANANKNREWTKESREKATTAHRNITPETRKKMSEAAKKRKATKETKNKMSLQRLGRKQTEEDKEKKSIAHKGRKFSEEHKRKIGISKSGEKCPFWKGGISSEQYCKKWTRELKERIRVFFENRCLCCGKHENELKRKLNCHHVEYNKNACCAGERPYFAALCDKHHAKTNFERNRWEHMLHVVIDEIYDSKSYLTTEEYRKLVK